MIKPRLTGEGDEDIPPPGPLMASADPGFMPGASSGTDRAQPPLIYGTDPEKKPDKPTFDGDLFYADHIRKELKQVPYGREMEWLRIQLKNAETDMQKKAVLDVAYEFQEQAYRLRPITRPGAYFGDPSDPKLRERLQKRYEEGKMWRTPEKYPDEFLSAIEHYFDPFLKLQPDYLDGVRPELREKVDRILDRMRAQGFDAHVPKIGGYRTLEEQLRLYQKGRRGIPGEGKVTGTKRGKHTEGRAVDIVSSSQGWGASEEFWQALGREAKREGLVWGAEFKNLVDKAHIELP